MRTNAACVTGTVFRMRFCKIAKPKPAASLAYQPPRSMSRSSAVQARRAANAIARQLRLRGSAAPLTGRLFDDRGNRMSPTHTTFAMTTSLLERREERRGEGGKREREDRASPAQGALDRYLGL